ncbi:MAG: hypothetical protein IT449_16435 [Phycisphaerales bacterium]|nr:hypothetical protein [Phycisphaerales bacterium]
MKNRFALAFLGLLAIVSWPGCAPTTGGGNDNVPDANDNVSDDGLTDEQQAAVDSVTAMLNDLNETLGSLAATADTASYTADGVGECPVVTASRDGTTTTLSLDFGDGCTNAATGETVYSGNVTVIVNFTALTFNVTFTDFTVDDASIAGSITATLQSLPRDDLPLAFSGTVDLTTNNGTLAGTISVTINPDTGLITITEGEVTVVDADENAYAVELADIALDPVNNGNLIPEGGTVSFDMATGIGDTTVTVTIEFTEETPTTGVVQITVGDAEPVQYTLAYFEEE